MEDKQKVYIKGNAERGDEIIKLLKDLGGCNSNALYGRDINAYYFINPKGIIYKVYPFDYDKVFPYVKEFYKEIKLPRWKPNYRESYFFIDSDGIIVEEVWYNKKIDKSRYEFGNCFAGIDEAKIARNQIYEK